MGFNQCYSALYFLQAIPLAGLVGNVWRQSDVCLPWAEIIKLPHGRLFYGAVVLSSVVAAVFFFIKFISASVAATAAPNTYNVARRPLLIEAFGLLVFVLSFALEVGSLPDNSCSANPHSLLLKSWARTETGSDFSEISICHRLMTFKWLTLSIVIVSFYAQLVGWLAVSEIDMADWAANRTGWRRVMLRALQIASAPLLFCILFIHSYRHVVADVIVVALVSWVFVIIAAACLLFLALFFALVLLVSPFKFGHALYTKLRRKPKAATTAKSTAPAIELQSVTVEHCSPAGTSPFERFLGIHDMVVELTRHCHTADMLNLTRVSRTTHRVLRKRGGTAPWKGYVCHGSATKCWCCDRTVCQTCSKTITTQDSRVPAFQRDTIQAICTKCYFLALCSPTGLFRSFSRQCDRVPLNHNSPHPQTGTTSESDICDRCSAKTADDAKKLKKLREARLNRVLLARYSHNPNVCAHCHCSIWSFSFRFWRCSVCEFQATRLDKTYTWFERWRVVYTRQFKEKRYFGLNWRKRGS